MFTWKQIYDMILKYENSADAQVWDNSDPILVSGVKKQEERQ